MKKYTEIYFITPGKMSHCYLVLRWSHTYNKPVMFGFYSSNKLGYNGRSGRITDYVIGKWEGEDFSVALEEARAEAIEWLIKDNFGNRKDKTIDYMSCETKGHCYCRGRQLCCLCQTPKPGYKSSDEEEEDPPSPKRRKIGEKDPCKGSGHGECSKQAPFKCCRCGEAVPRSPEPESESESASD